MEPSPSECIYSTALAPTNGGNGKSRKFAAIACHLGISEATLTDVSPVRLLKQDMNKDDSNRHAHMIGELAGPQPSTKLPAADECGEWEKLSSSGAMTPIPVLETCSSKLYYGLRKWCVCEYMCVYPKICVCMWKYIWKRFHEFERRKGEVGGEFGGER